MVLQSRSMREDPNPEKPGHEKTFTGDNFVRKSGDFHNWQALNLHSVAAQNRGQEVAMMVRLYHFPPHCTVSHLHLGPCPVSGRAVMAALRPHPARLHSQHCAASPWGFWAVQRVSP